MSVSVVLLIQLKWIRLTGLAPESIRADDFTKNTYEQTFLPVRLSLCKMPLPRSLVEKGALHRFLWKIEKVQKKTSFDTF